MIGDILLWAFYVFMGYLVYLFIKCMVKGIVRMFSIFKKKPRPIIETIGRYRFQYRYVNNGWRAYILAQPHYGNRPSDGHSTHRMRDDGGIFICWTHPIPTLEGCQNVAKLWAQYTDNYIALGTPFSA